MSTPSDSRALSIATAPSLRRLAAAHAIWTLLSLAVWFFETSWTSASFTVDSPPSLAVGIVWGAGSVSLWMLGLAGQSRAIAALGGLAARGMIPVVAGFAALQSRPSLEAAGFRVLLTGAFAALLAVELALTVWLLDPRLSYFQLRQPAPR